MLKEYLYYHLIVFNSVSDPDFKDPGHASGIAFYLKQNNK